MERLAIQILEVKMPLRVTKAIFLMPLNIIIKHTDIFQIHSDVVPTLIYELLLVLNDVCVKSRRKKKVKYYFAGSRFLVYTICSVMLCDLFHLL